MHPCMHSFVPLCLVVTIQTTFFAQSLSNFTCKLMTMRGGTLVILGQKIKAQGQLWPPGRGNHTLHCPLKIDSKEFFFQDF